MKFGKAIPHDVHIEPTANMGFFVHVGCCHVVFTDIGTMVDALTEYLQNPKGVAQEYSRDCGGGKATIERATTTQGVAVVPGPTGSGGIVR